MLANLGQLGCITLQLKHCILQFTIHNILVNFISKRHSSCCVLPLFASYRRKGDTVLMNNSSGYLVRSKPASVNEGGVTVGVASLNTLELMSEEEYLKCVQQ